ncbi:MAG: ribosome silencing factor [Myxococcales bacterium]|nr:ribosome silencing factor [Myxococcales bacterium]
MRRNSSSRRKPEKHLTPSPASSLSLARELAHLLEEKKARRMRLLDIGAHCSYTDFVLLASAGNERHARALAEHLIESMREKKRRPLGVEGVDAGQWVLLDFGDAVVHILQEPVRELYDLDHLWPDTVEHPVGEDA